MWQMIGMQRELAVESFEDDGKGAFVMQFCLLYEHLFQMGMTKALIRKTKSGAFVWTYSTCLIMQQPEEPSTRGTNAEGDNDVECDMYDLLQEEMQGELSTPTHQ